MTMQQIAIIVFSYFLGSVSFGYMIGHLSGKDVRKVGSGNIGATNVMRAVGKTAGIVTLVLDTAKGYVAVFLGEQFSGPDSSLPLICGIAALLGHCFPVLLKFRGGKGVATALGVFLRLTPFYAIFGLGAFLIVVAITRFVSAGSMAAAATMPIALWIGGYSSVRALLAAAIAALIIGKHHKNIARLARGEENKLGARRV
ncbi:MAG: glycerol-3-phosphate 1-O-acyltransferase PlsY [Candidatus Coatesbacteria bacterium]|nr:glycerol-3-phosphate 1-O-acyltransferase PlsY [Candidatus Coatesbacteria bacterium]